MPSLEAGEERATTSAGERKSEPLNFADRPDEPLGGQFIALSGLVGFIAALALRLARVIQPSESYILFGWVLGFTLTPMVCLSLFVNKVRVRSSTGLAGAAGSLHWKRCFTKYLGLLVTLAGLAGCYWLFPEYSKPFYEPCWKMARVVAWPVLLASFPYIVWVDRRQKAPYDAYWQVGQLALCRWRVVQRQTIGSHAAAWAVKGFFLPFMVAGGAQNLEILTANGFDLRSFDDLYAKGINFLYALDVVFGAIGYCLTLQILDAQIRTTDPKLVGWLSALCCYPPFGHLFQASFLDYRGPFVWQERWPWAQHPFLYVSWGFTVLVLHGIYAWATCSFGYRFSNLTNRGIIREGPYRYLKHPAYVSKNLAWWLMYAPFAAFATWQQCLRSCLLLGVTNLIYAARAWTEERHLCSDPAYVEYCRWMDKHGLLAVARTQINRLATVFMRRSVVAQP